MKTLNIGIAGHDRMKARTMSRPWRPQSGQGEPTAWSTRRPLPRFYSRNLLLKPAHDCSHWIFLLRMLERLRWRARNYRFRWP